MTEQQWLSLEDPSTMLHFISTYQTTLPSGHLPTDRKLRLWVEACLGACTCYGHKEALKLSSVHQVAAFTDVAGCPSTRAYKAALLRDLFGNPWQEWVYEIPGALGTPMVRWPSGRIDALKVVEQMRLRPRILRRSWLSWNDGTVPKIAQAIYDGKQCDWCLGGGGNFGPENKASRTLGERCGKCRGAGRVSCFEEMPILADALEEAGCENEEIMRHCRGEERCVCELPTERPRHPNGLNLSCNQCRDGWLPLRGPHVRGCWVLDLLLGKE